MKYSLQMATSIFFLSMSAFVFSEPASVSILSPKNGDTVPSKFLVKFGAKNIAIVPAGTDQANGAMINGVMNSGHHHLIVDGELPDLNMPMGTNVIHFGKGQTETELELAPGKHTLQLILGDNAHVPHKPAIISEKITITVEK